MKVNVAEDTNEILGVLAEIHNQANEIASRHEVTDDTMGAMIQLLSMQVTLLVMMTGDVVIRSARAAGDAGGCDCPDCQ